MSETNKLNIIETESNIIFDSCAHSKIDLSLNNDNCTIFNDITMGTNILNLSRYIYVDTEQKYVSYTSKNIIREKEFDIVKDPYKDDIYYIVLNNVFSDTNTIEFNTYICVLQEDINENLNLINKINITSFEWKGILDIDQNYIYAWGIEYQSIISSTADYYAIYVYKISKNDYSCSEIYRYVNKLKADVIFMGKNETYFSFLLKYENSRNINNKPFLKIIRFDKTTQTIVQSQKSIYSSVQYRSSYYRNGGGGYSTGYSVCTISWIPVYNYDYYYGVQVFDDNIIRITTAYSGGNLFDKDSTQTVYESDYSVNQCVVTNFKLFRELVNIICKKGIKINNTYYILYPAVSSNTNFNYSRNNNGSYSSQVNPSTGVVNYTTTIREKLVNNFHLISYNVDNDSFSENLQFTNIKYITNLKWFDDKDTIYKVWDNDDRIFYAVYNANTNNKDAMLNIQAIHVILKNNGNFAYEKSIFPSKTSQIIAITNTEDTKKILIGYPGAIEIWEYDETNNTYVQGKKITQVLTGGFDNLGRVIYKDVNKNTFILDTKDCESVDLQFEKQRYIFFNQPINTYLDFSSKNYMGTETKSTFDITLSDNCVFEDSGTNTITVNHTEPQRINFSIIDNGNIECTVRYNKNWSNYE